MQSSSEQPLVGEEHCVTTRITAAKEASYSWVQTIFLFTVVKVLNGSHTWVVTPFEWNFSMVKKINAFKKLLCFFYEKFVSTLNSLFVIYS